MISPLELIGIFHDMWQRDCEAQSYYVSRSLRGKTLPTIEKQTYSQLRIIATSLLTNPDSTDPTVHNSRI